MYSKKLTVMPSETACTNEIKVRSLLNHFQDTASLSATGFEGSPGELARRGYTWILLRYQLEVNKRLPTMDESLVIETRYTMNDGLRVLRDFRVFAQACEAEALVSAKTSWVLTDLATERPVRASQHLSKLFCDLADGIHIDPEFTAVPRLSGSTLKDVPLLREVDLPVRFHDLDANGHVNNAVYFEWMYEATPLDLMGWGIRAVSAEFRAGTKFNETVRVGVKPVDPVIMNPVASDRDGRNHAFAYDMARVDDDRHSVARFCALWTPMN